MRRASVLAVLLCLLVSACSGREATTEEVNGLEKKLTSSQSPLGIPLEKEQAECVANVYLTADFSDKTRQELLAGKPISPKTDDDRDALNDVTKKIADDCL